MDNSSRSIIARNGHEIQSALFLKRRELAEAKTRNCKIGYCRGILSTGEGGSVGGRPQILYLYTRARPPVMGPLYLIDVFGRVDAGKASINLMEYEWHLRGNGFC